MQNRTVFLINVMITVLAIVASAFGAFGEIYKDHHWAASQLKGQDIVSIIIALVFLFSLFLPQPKAKFIKTGLLGYFIYTYVTYAFGPALNEMLLVYIAILSLSIFAFVKSLMQIDEIEIVPYNNVWFVVCAVYLILFGVMLSVLWLGDIFGNLKGEPLLANPTGEPLLEVYVLDLGFVIPAFFIGSVMMLRKKVVGFIVTAIMLIKSTTMGFALIGMTIASFVFGYGLEMFLVYLWGILGIVGLILTLLFLIKLKVSV